jgi:hypothetical protein
MNYIGMIVRWHIMTLGSSLQWTNFLKISFLNLFPWQKMVMLLNTSAAVSGSIIHQTKASTFTFTTLLYAISLENDQINETIFGEKIASRNCTSRGP